VACADEGDDGESYDIGATNREPSAPVQIDAAPSDRMTG